MTPSIWQYRFNFLLDRGVQACTALDACISNPASPSNEASKAAPLPRRPRRPPSIATPQTCRCPSWILLRDESSGDHPDKSPSLIDLVVPWWTRTLIISSDWHSQWYLLLSRQYQIFITALPLATVPTHSTQSFQSEYRQDPLSRSVFRNTRKRVHDKSRRCIYVGTTHRPYIC